ncbi:unnamed protein product, partial [Staurois parvus]
YCQKYCPRPPNHVVQVFQFPPNHVIHVFQFPPNHVIQCRQFMQRFTYTLYCQKYCPRPPNHVIQVLQSPPWTQVYTIKPLGMQTASTNIGERMGHSQELSDSKRGPVIGGHLGNKSIRHISWLLNIPRSTVSGI